MAQFVDAREMVGCDDVETCGYRWPKSTISNPIGEICPKCEVGRIIDNPGPSKPAALIRERRELERSERALQRRAIEKG